MKYSFFLLTCISFIVMSCNSDDSDGGISDPQAVANLMNESLILPPGTFTVDPSTVTIDNSVVISGNTSNTVGLTGGQQMSNSITFNSQNGATVNAVGMRFGTTGPIYFVPIDTDGATSGTATFDFTISPEICGNLSQICHDIQCYEFAQTSSGAISAADIQNVAMLCGNCDEPSCQGLVDSTECNAGNGLGSGSFSSSITGELTGSSNCDTASGTASIVNSNWSVIIVNAPSSGSFNFNGDYYLEGCSSCVGFQLTNNNTGESYFAISGNGSYGSQGLSVSGTIINTQDAAEPNPQTYSLSAVFDCN